MILKLHNLPNFRPNDQRLTLLYNMLTNKIITDQIYLILITLYQHSFQNEIEKISYIQNNKEILDN